MLILCMLFFFYVIIERLCNGEFLFVRGVYWKESVKLNYYSMFVYLLLLLFIDDG